MVPTAEPVRVDDTVRSASPRNLASRRSRANLTLRRSRAHLASKRSRAHRLQVRVDDIVRYCEAKPSAQSHLHELAAGFASQPGLEAEPSTKYHLHELITGFASQSGLEAKPRTQYRLQELVQRSDTGGCIQKLETSIKLSNFDYD